MPHSSITNNRDCGDSRDKGETNRHDRIEAAKPGRSAREDRGDHCRSENAHCTKRCDGNSGDKTGEEFFIHGRLFFHPGGKAHITSRDGQRRHFGLAIVVGDNGRFFRIRNLDGRHTINTR